MQQEIIKKKEVKKRRIEKKYKTHLPIKIRRDDEEK